MEKDIDEYVQRVFDVLMCSNFFTLAVVQRRANWLLEPMANVPGCRIIEWTQKRGEEIIDEIVRAVQRFVSLRQG